MDCLWLSGQPVFNQAVWMCQACGESQSSTLSCVSAPRPDKSEATAGQAPGTGLEKTESQPEEGGAAGGDFQPHSAKTEHLLCPSTPPPDRVFKQQCWDPSSSPQNPPGHLTTPDLNAAASPGGGEHLSYPLQPPLHQQPFP